jgi:hypothetical protein
MNNDHALATLPAGVTRLRLSQSREAPPAPVIMPGDLMPELPGNRVDVPSAGTALAPPPESPPAGGVRTERALCRYVTVKGTFVKGGGPYLCNVIFSPVGAPHQIALVAPPALLCRVRRRIAESLM